jgi:hypothetical protein
MFFVDFQLTMWVRTLDYFLRHCHRLILGTQSVPCWRLFRPQHRTKAERDRLHD